MKNIRKVFSKKKVCGNQSGFTLLEVLIAISILTIGLLGVAQMQIMGIKGNYFSGNTTAALALAEEQMEGLLGESYANVISGNDADNPIDETGQAGGIYTRTWVVADNSPITGTKTVTVNVGWDPAHQVSLSCIKPQ